MRQKRCHCQAFKCKGALIEEHTARAHARRDLREKTVASQAEFRRVGERFVPSAAQDTRPVLRGYSVPLHEPQPLLSPNAQFQDPRCISESPVEQEMLDYGLLTGEDLDLMTHGIALPNLGPNFHSPEALLDAVDHFGAYNAATSSGSRPLTSYEAHHLPPDPEQHALNRQIEDAFEAVQNEGGNEHGFDDLDIDVDGTFDDQNEDDDNLVITPMNPDEDDPDPFMPEDGFNMTNPVWVPGLQRLVIFPSLDDSMPQRSANIGCIKRFMTGCSFETCLLAAFFSAGFSVRLLRAISCSSTCKADSLTRV
ncbi:uncharacterized protein F5147DRAFT_274411 [Suillus discolor]|uniref:Uncharacterized protein n=1 Tax=Suillus discolor TaxID=1912936 RepID=A0A9P7JRY6_9AGAM|nr:uncharacterized protein F5147DRAFT_274411 [Suillus discolor]KAG2103693.1 hypothetical protein F5147DRAFT_274411 [Suillus discolor]